MSPSEMTEEQKLRIVNEYLDKLMLIGEKAVNRKKYNLALSALSSYCSIQYGINQVYTVAKAEELLMKISKDVVTVPADYEVEKNTVLFYDGFGLDLRGWAASFAKALSSLQYKVVYVVPAHKKGKIPHILSELEKGNGIIEYIDMKISYLEEITSLYKVFNQHKPRVAFFYTTPNDVSGTVVFDAYVGKTRRIQIDLTDHAYWIGTKAVDFCTESRDIGVSNAIYHRGIPFGRILRMDGCPYINRDIDSKPLPFDIEKEKYVFSGGSLYKTLGDENLYYYKIVDHILAVHKGIKFLFAGGGDDSEIKKLIQKYPGRMFCIEERSDFIRLFQNSLFFLNTYPMFGGLMMRYAAMVDRIPLTLIHSADHEGILNNQSKRGIEFESYEEVIKEADRLIDDPEYRKHKEKGLIGSVVTENDFKLNIQMMIDEGRTIDKFEQVAQVDTTQFRAEYLERLKPEALVLESIAKRKNAQLIKYFPALFIQKTIRRCRNDKF